jgi:hypothetical protein
MEYLQKEDLRQIKILGATPRVEPREGYFHNFFRKVGDTGEEYMWALVELENGEVVEVGATAVVFMT